MNVCPTVTFSSTGLGDDNNPVFNNFMWTLKKNQLKVIYKNKNLNQTFPDTTYFVYFTEEKDRLDLVIRHNDHSYYLSKSFNPK